ncbi:MAG: TIGR00730 family Rossman fold protein [Clostridia bacterium]|nr:TIGR00730 family Rossman fold protein [Clostridia bacterium]
MKIFVGCSSRDVGNADYNHVADRVGEWIATSGHDLVFGGCGKGLMGRIFSKVKGHGKIYATQAKVYQDEVIGLDADSIEVIDTINQRKNRYTELADVLVFIPGGIGTLDELISGIETRRSGEHENPIVIVNEGNFFGALLEQLEKIYDEELASESVKKYYYVAKTVDEAIEKLAEICNK